MDRAPSLSNFTITFRSNRYRTRIRKLPAEESKSFMLPNSDLLTIDHAPTGNLHTSTISVFLRNEHPFASTRVRLICSVCGCTVYFCDI